jgi:hypothetical protein
MEPDAGRAIGAVIDDELIAAIAAGDDTALRDLFARHAPWLAVRLRASLSVADTEDVVSVPELGELPACRWPVSVIDGFFLAAGLVFG